LLANGIVYIAWGSHCDTGPYHGWIMGYDSVTLAQVLAQTVTPNGEGGGIWQSGAGPSADASGNLYLTLGEGTTTVLTGGQDYGNALLKLSPLGEVLDWFIPFNFRDLDPSNLDLGTTGVLLFPNSNLLLIGSKEGTLNSLKNSERDDFGEFSVQHTGCCQWQRLSRHLLQANCGVWAAAARRCAPKVSAGPKQRRSRCVLIKTAAKGGQPTSLEWS
jgi:hypothetical protein